MYGSYGNSSYRDEYQGKREQSHSELRDLGYQRDSDGMYSYSGSTCSRKYIGANGQIYAEM